MALLEVLGTGCGRCAGLLRNAEAAVRQAGSGDTLVKVTDYERMLALGPSALPALALNGRIILAGRIASSEEILKHLGADPAPP